MLAVMGVGDFFKQEKNPSIEPAAIEIVSNLHRVERTIVGEYQGGSGNIRESQGNIRESQGKSRKVREILSYLATGASFHLKLALRILKNVVILSYLT